jgi:hypothetical protein
MSTPSTVYVKPYRAIIGTSYIGANGQTTQPSGGGTISSTTNAQSTTLIADAVIEEEGDDEVVVTDHPVEQGSTISDNAYILPARLSVVYGWSAGSPQNTGQDSSFLKTLYQQFITLAQQRIGCSVYTGKRVYTNMLVTGVSLKTDKETENCVFVRVRFKQILLASVTTVPLTNSAQQSLPQQTSGTTNQGTVSLQAAPNFNAGAAP